MSSIVQVEDYLRIIQVSVRMGSRIEGLFDEPGSDRTQKPTEGETEPHRNSALPEPGLQRPPLANRCSISQPHRAHSDFSPEPTRQSSIPDSDRGRSLDHGKARYLAHKLLHKPSKDVKPMSENLDNFFECFAAHHAIVDAVTGRFNLTPVEHDKVVYLIQQMMQRHEDGLIPVEEFEVSNLAEKWAFRSDRVLSPSVCRRVIQLARISALNGHIDGDEFISTVLKRERHSASYKKWKDRFLSLALIILYYICGSVFYWKYCRFSFIQSIYFVTVSVTTVGYGDVVPHDNFSRMFTVFYIGLGMVLIVGIIYRAIMDILNSYQARITEVGKGVIEITNPKKRKRKIIALYALHIFYAGVLIGGPMLLGMIVMYFTAPPEQDMDLIKSFYWAAETCTTIGYGDFTPIGDWNKLWVCAYILLGVTCISAAIAQVGTLHLTIRAYKRMEVLQNKQLALSLIAQLDSKARGVDKFEFLAAMLLVLEKVEPSEISEILSQFDELDTNKTGLVSTNDVVAMQKRGQLPTSMTVRSSLMSQHEDTMGGGLDLP